MRQQAAANDNRRQGLLRNAGCVDTDPRDLQLVTRGRSSSPNTFMTNLPADFVPVDFEFEFLRRDRDGNPYIMVNPVNDLSDPSMVSIRIPINNPPSQLLPMQLAKSE